MLPGSSEGINGREMVFATISGIGCISFGQSYYVNNIAQQPITDATEISPLERTSIIIENIQIRLVSEEMRFAAGVQFLQNSETDEMLSGRMKGRDGQMERLMGVSNRADGMTLKVTMEFGSGCCGSA